MDDTSLHGGRSWGQILANPSIRKTLSGIDGGGPEGDPLPKGAGMLALLRQPVSAGSFKRLMTAEIVKGKDIPADGSMPSFGELLQTRVSAENIKRLVRGRKD